MIDFVGEQAVKLEGRPPVLSHRVTYHGIAL